MKASACEGLELYFCKHRKCVEIYVLISVFIKVKQLLYPEGLL